MGPQLEQAPKLIPVNLGKVELPDFELKINPEPIFCDEFYRGQKNSCKNLICRASLYLLMNGIIYIPPFFAQYIAK